jgi:hypothetical protein
MDIRGLLLVAWSGCVVREECYQHEDCSGDEFCWYGSCEQATDRYWTVEMVAAEVGWVHPDGLPWDTDSSPPDLYVEFGFDWDLCLTSYVPDDFAPVWYESCDFYVPHSPTLTVDLWDVDGVMDEFATGWTWSGEGDFTALARTAGTETGFVDPSGTIVLWVELWPY